MPLVERGRDNVVSAGADRGRLNGQVYTPMSLARRLVRGLRWPRGLMDPACGDGVFLEAAVREAVATGRSEAVGRIVGWDLDPHAVEATRGRLRDVAVELGVPGPGQVGGPKLRVADALEAEPEQPLSVIVGNPPYLESKRMPDALKARIRATCPHAGRGGFDLYAAFVERSSDWLTEDGELVFIVPNRILVTRSTGALRRHLLRLGAVHVEDLSEADVFGTAAAVYPIVLRLLRGGSGYHVGDARFPVELVRDRLGGLLPLPPSDPVLRALLVRTLTDPRIPPLSDRLQVRWTVSFHRAGLRDAYVFDASPDSPHARPFLGGGRFAGNREVEPYEIRWAGSWIDFDEERARRDRNKLPDLALFTEPKVVFTQNARRCRAALDTAGFVLKDTFPLITARPEAHPDDLAWAVLVLNSTLFHVLYESLYGGTRKGGRFLSFLGSYLHPFPFPAAPDGARALHDVLVASPDAPMLRAAAEALVRKAYGVTPDEAALLDRIDVPT